jgi:c(7)-type cytochrome triheme protein
MTTRVRLAHVGAAFAFAVALVLLPGIAAVIGAGCSRPAPAQQQPIYFRHDIHAGVNQIPCQYCHANASRSTAATVPPVAVCAGCHKVGGVEGTTPEFKAEIKKVMQYADQKKQIPWVRIHDLPDFVYFSHKRHVRAGIDCSRCHGDVAKMKNVHAVNVLSMGFCVSCHRAHAADKVYPASIDCLTCHK